MKLIFIPIMLMGLSSCSNVSQGPYGKDNMAEDSIDWGYNKYNMMDSSDGSGDPNARIKIWGAKY